MEKSWDTNHKSYERGRRFSPRVGHRVAQPRAWGGRRACLITRRAEPGKLSEVRGNAAHLLVVVKERTSDSAPFTYGVCEDDIGIKLYFQNSIFSQLKIALKVHHKYCIRTNNLKQTDARSIVFWHHSYHISKRSLLDAWRFPEGYVTEVICYSGVLGAS